jgi:Flp pilus assembly protein TadG
MRVRPLIERLAKDERGVSGFIVAITMVVLLGMVALSSDFGLLFVKRRGMVNANDAAALAAAISCARKDGQAAADAQADALATSNVNNAARAANPTYDPSCSAAAGKVTVHYQASQKLYFAPIVGVSSPKTVSFASTARWGVSGGAGGLLPVQVSEGRLTTCSIPNTLPGTECWFYLDNSPSGYGTASWSLLNVSQDCTAAHYGWDVRHARCPSQVGLPDPTYHCTQYSASEMRDLIANGSGALSMSPSGVTYVCNSTGNPNSVFNDIASLKGQVRLVAVNDPTKQIKSGGILAPPPQTPDMYAIVGFIAMRIQDLWKSNDPKWDTVHCPGPKGPSAWCLHAVWVGYSTSPGDICDSCQDFGIRAVKLSG